MIEILLWAVVIGLPFGALVGYGLERQLVRLMIEKANPDWRTAVKLRDAFFYVVPEREYNDLQQAWLRDQRRAKQRRDAKGRFKKG